MNTVKIEKKQVKMVAHRGLSGIETENSNFAFVAAANRSYFGIETDVRLTADGRYVLLHDDTTARVSDTIIHIEKEPRDKVKSVMLRDREDGATRMDIRIPDLDDYLKICKRYDKVSVLEIKGSMSEQQLRGVADACQERNQLENTIFISFGLENLLTLRKITPPGQQIQFLCGELSDEFIDILAANRIDIDIHYPTLFAHPEYMEKFKARGLKVNVWTCDNPGDAAKLIEMGVDFITTDILE